MNLLTDLKDTFNKGFDAKYGIVLEGNVDSIKTREVLLVHVDRGAALNQAFLCSLKVLQFLILNGSNLPRREPLQEVILHASNPVVQEADQISVDLLDVWLNNIVVERQLLEDTASLQLLTRHKKQ
jgi:hypothetical protein